MGTLGSVDEDIRKLIDRAIDPDFVGRLVADPDAVIRANGWRIPPDRLIAALRSAGVAPADVEVLQSRVSYSGLGRLLGSAIHIGQPIHHVQPQHGDLSSAAGDPAGSASSGVDPSANDAAGAAAATDVGSDAPASETVQAAAPGAADADDPTGGVPLVIDDPYAAPRNAPVEGVADGSGD